MGICLFIYQDDLLVLHQLKEELIQLTPLICQLFEALSLVINQNKSRPTPHQNMEFLGHSKSTADFPAKKLRKVQQLAQHLLHQPRISVRKERPQLPHGLYGQLLYISEPYSS